MHANEQLIKNFYTSFQKKDYKGMQVCYSEKVIFNDPVFKNLDYQGVNGMWEMLLSRGKDLKITFDGVSADDTEGKGHWIAEYTFSPTGNKVINDIQASFEFENGLIVRHTDRFDLYKWSRQAFGFQGMLFGWTGYFQNKVQATAGKNLKRFLEKKLS